MEHNPKRNLNWEDIDRIRVGSAVVFNPDMNIPEIKAQGDIIMEFGLLPNTVYTVEDIVDGYAGELCKGIDAKHYHKRICCLKVRGAKYPIGIGFFTLPDNSRLAG